MIEIIIKNYLDEKLGVPVNLEVPENPPERFIVFEKTSSNKENYLKSATFAFQSYAESMYQAAHLNEQLKEAVEQMIELDRIAKIKLNSDYNFTDTTTKKYRYQAVYDIYHY